MMLKEALASEVLIGYLERLYAINILKKALIYFKITKAELETVSYSVEAPRVVDKVLFWRVCTFIEQGDHHKSKTISKWSEPSLVVE